MFTLSEELKRIAYSPLSNIVLVRIGTGIAFPQGTIHMIIDANCSRTAVGDISSQVH